MTDSPKKTLMSFLGHRLLRAWRGLTYAKVRDIINIFLQFFILLVLILTVQTYKDSNSINKSTHVAWIKVETPKAAYQNKTLTITWAIHNVSDTPAFKMMADFSCDQIPITSVTNYSQLVMLPTEQFQAVYESSDANGEAVYKALTSGQAKIKFREEYYDLFDKKVILTETISFDQDGYGRPVSSTAEGSDIN